MVFRIIFMILRHVTHSVFLFPFFFSRPQNFLFKSLGVVLNKVGNKDFVQNHLNIMFSSVKHSSQLEREVRLMSFHDDNVFKP